ncbi:MAG: collagen-like protein [Actinomycetota bacterium]|nr:collagen-like protein [Actinomycetota bacterium]
MKTMAMLQKTKLPVAVVFGLVLGATGFVLADGGDTSEVHACVKTTRPDKGATRIVGATKECRDDEKSVHWNKQGPPGTPAVTEFAEFFALMPPDNAATVATGAAVHFPQDVPTSTSITRINASTFLLSDFGTYRVSFVVSVTEAGQLALRLNGSELPYTVAGRATGTSQIVGESLVEATTVNSTLEVVNPADNTTALTITPLAGGTEPVSASLVIQRLD